MLYRVWCHSTLRSNISYAVSCHWYELSFTPLSLLLLFSVSEDPVITKLSRHNAVSELDAAIDLQHTCGYVTMLRAMAKRRTSTADSSRPSPTTSAGDPTTTTTTTHVYRGQSVGIDVAPDGISTSSKDDPMDCGVTNFTDLEKASLHDGVDGLDRSSPMKYRSGSVDTEVDEDEWVLLDCHFGVPLFDAEVNQSVCRRIAKYGLCNQSRYLTSVIFTGHIKYFT